MSLATIRSEHNRARQFRTQFVPSKCLGQRNLFERPYLSGVRRAPLRSLVGSHCFDRHGGSALPLGEPAGAHRRARLGGSGGHPSNLGPVSVLRGTMRPG